MHNMRGILLKLLVAASAAISQAGASEVQTASFSEWMKMVTGSYGTWAHAIPPGYNALDNAAGYDIDLGTFGVINVTGPDGNGYLLNGSADPVTLSGANDGIGTVNITTQPAAGLTAFYIELLGNAPVTLTLDDGEIFTLSPTDNPDGAAFLGLSSYRQINSMVFSTGPGSQVILADFYAGQSAEPTPEPPTGMITACILILAGLANLYRISRGLKCAKWALLTS